jgi:hypothetical protein
MMELADIDVSKASARKGVRVRVPLPAQQNISPQNSVPALWNTALPTTRGDSPAEMSVASGKIRLCTRKPPLTSLFGCPLSAFSIKRTL